MKSFISSASWSWWLSWQAILEFTSDDRPLAIARQSKQYLAKAVEYGDLANASPNSTQRHEFQELEGKFSVLAVLADNEQMLEDDAFCNANVDGRSHNPRSRRSCSAMPWSCTDYAMEYAAGRATKTVIRQCRRDGRVVGHFYSKRTNRSLLARA